MDNIATRLAERLGISTRAAAGEPITVAESAAVPPARSSSREDARALDSIYRALFILETAARQLSLDVWRGDQLLPEIPSIVRQPSLSMTQRAFVAYNVQCLAQRGNAFWKLTRSERMDVVDIELLNPLEVFADLDSKSRRLIYSWRGRRLKADELIHLKLTHQPGEALGLGPVQACISTITGALDMRHYADAWIDRSGRPTGIFSTEQHLTADQAREYKNAANTAFTPGNGVAVLGGGLSYQPTLLAPKELQLLESQEANVVSMARIFGIPARLMLVSPTGGSQTYANLEQDELSFLRYTLMAYLGEIEDAFDQVTARGQTVRFNVDGLLRTDTKTRYEAHKIGIEAGFLSAAEARAIEGLPKLKENR